MGLAAVQCRTRACVTGREIIQHDDVAANFLIAEGDFGGDGRFDQIHAGVDVRDQGHEIGNDRAMEVVSILREGRGSTACRVA